jgi:HK97 family phage major capsid protein
MRQATTPPATRSSARRWRAGSRRSDARLPVLGIDNAFFGNTVTNGPSGLLSLSATAVDTGTITAVANLDFFHDAKKKAYDNNSELTHFVISPAIALQLAKIKVLSSGSNQGLLETVDDGVLLAGLPALVSPSVDALTFAWGIDASQVMVVRRTGTTIATSKDAAFGEDALQIRATSRVGFGFANPPGVVRLYDAA